MSDKILNNIQLESWITFINLEKQKPVLTILLLFGPSQNYNVSTFYIQTSDVAVLNQMSPSWMVLKTLILEDIQNEIMK